MDNKIAEQVYEVLCCGVPPQRRHGYPLWSDLESQDRKEYIEKAELLANVFKPRVVVAAVPPQVFAQPVAVVTTDNWGSPKHFVYTGAIFSLKAGEHKLYANPPVASSSTIDDTVRLDWLAHHGAALRYDSTTLTPELRGWYVLIPGRLNHYKRYPTARDGIDAEMGLGKANG